MYKEHTRTTIGVASRSSKYGQTLNRFEVKIECEYNYPLPLTTKKCIKSKLSTHVLLIVDLNRP